MLPCCEVILKEKNRSLYRQNSVLDFFNASSGFYASPPVLLYTGNDDPDDPHIVLVEVLSPGIVTSCHKSFYILDRIFLSISFLLVKINCLNHLSYFNVAFRENVPRLNVVGLRTNYDVILGVDYSYMPSA